MKKVNFTGNVISIPSYVIPIRTKYQLITLLLETLEYILSGAQFLPQPDNVELFDVLIHIEKMSRIFYVSREGKRIFSFNFPFRIVSAKSRSTIKIYHYNSLDALEQHDIFVIKQIFKLNFNDNKSKPNTFDKLFDVFTDETVINYGLDKAYNFYQELINFEPGYIRYDCDPDRADEDYHPLHHLDLFYSNNNTFKLGLYSGKNILELSKLLNIREKCVYLVEDKASESI